jgi:nucleotide-binding universal stress UspA family protein
VDPESSPPPVVVGVDASLAAQQAARFAAAEARLRRAPLHVVTVMPWPYRGPAAPPPPGIDLPTVLGDGGASLIRATSDALHDEGGGRGVGGVVVGVEGRQGDEEVLGFAFAEAPARGTDVPAVHAWKDVVLDTGIRTVSPLVDWAGVLADEERLLAQALAGWREVGHRKRRPSLGSTTHGVLHRAACPVAIVPITGAGR